MVSSKNFHFPNKTFQSQLESLLYLKNQCYHIIPLLHISLVVFSSPNIGVDDQARRETEAIKWPQDEGESC